MSHVVRSVVLLLIIIYIDGFGGIAKTRLSACEIMARLAVFACMIAVLFCRDRYVWEVFGFTLIAIDIFLRNRLPCQGTSDVHGSPRNLPRGLVFVLLSFSALFLGGMLAFRMTTEESRDRDCSRCQTVDIVSNGSSLLGASRVESALKVWCDIQKAKVLALYFDGNGEIKTCVVKREDGTSWNIDVRVVGDKVYFDDRRNN